MELSDLSIYPGHAGSGQTDLLAVGWLSVGSHIGDWIAPPRVLTKLESRCSNPTYRTRGFHVCSFCTGNEPQTGNGVIHVQGEKCLYVAPDLIFHYVSEHGYHPPQEFIDAVLNYE